MPSSRCWDAISSIDRSFVLCALIRVKALLESHQQQVPQLGIWERCPGSTALGMVFVIRTGHHFNTCFALSPLLTHTHLPSHCMHTKFIIPVMNLYNPTSGLCADWLEMDIADKRKRPRVLSKDFTLSDLKQENIFSSQAMKAHYCLCCLLVLNSSLEILQDTPRLTMTSS